MPERWPGGILRENPRGGTASPARAGCPAGNSTDENPRTFWVAGQNRPGAWVTLDLGRVYSVKAIQVNYADYKSGLYGTDSTVYTQFRLAVSADGRQWKTVADLSHERRDRPNAYIALPTTMNTRYMRFEPIHGDATNLPNNDIGRFCDGPGPHPATPLPAPATAAPDDQNRPPPPPPCQARSDRQLTRGDPPP